MEHSLHNSIALERLPEASIGRVTRQLKEWRQELIESNYYADSLPVYTNHYLPWNDEDRAYLEANHTDGLLSLSHTLLRSETAIRAQIKLMGLEPPLTDAD